MTASHGAHFGLFLSSVLTAGFFFAFLFAFPPSEMHFACFLFFYFFIFPPPCWLWRGWNTERLRSSSVPTTLHWGCEWLQLAAHKLKSKPVLFHTWAWQNSAPITSYFLGAGAWQFKLQHTDEICVVGRKGFDALEGVLCSGRTQCIKKAGLELWISTKLQGCVCVRALKIQC